MKYQLLALAVAIVIASQHALAQDVRTVGGQLDSTSAMSASAYSSQPADSVYRDDTAALRAQLERLETQQVATRRSLDQIRDQLGYAPAAQEVAGDPGAVVTPSPDIPGVEQPGVQCPPEQSLVERLGTRYNNGFVLVESPDPKRIPFQLQLNVFNQFRYLNQNVEPTFTDHLGNVRPVDSRNDFNLNRNLYYFGGYAFDQKMIFNIIIWSSNSLSSVIQGGYIGYQFDKSFTLYGGYLGIPGSRTMTRDFMWLQGVERSMADSYFRPGFTQGVWCDGQLRDDLFYVAFVGNSLNTVNVSTSKIDKNFIYSGSTWWEPWGEYGPPGAYRMAFSDFEYHDCPAIRLGTSFTGGREDRFSNPASNPENVALYNSDGTLFFATGSLAPGVTVSYADAYISSLDCGYKHRGLALNGQYYFRWLNNFNADGPLPLSETFDNGFELSLGYFLVPQTYELYGRTSAVFGEFRDSSEYAIGSNWHPFHNRGFRVITELNKVEASPTASIQTIYNAGMTGWNFCIQTQFYF